MPSLSSEDFCQSDLSTSLRDLLAYVSLLASHSHQKRDFKTHYKSGNEPCTSVDLAVNDILKERLLSIYPKAYWLSEESKDTKERIGKDSVWIVDPIDGTSDFASGSHEYSISVGLCKNRFPILGGVALPPQRRVIVGNQEKGIRDSLFSLPEEKDIDTKAGELSWEEFSEELLPRLSWKEKDVHLPQGKEISLSKAKILVSKTEWKNKRLNPAAEEFHCIPQASIARKLALLAVGEADLIVSVFPKQEWDIAGGTALILSHPHHSVKDLLAFQDHLFNSDETKSFGLVAGENHLVESFFRYFQNHQMKCYKSYV